MLREGQDHVFKQLAIHAPWVVPWSSATLTSSDSGATYALPSSVVPLAVELYENSTGRFLVPCWYPDSGGDYVWEGTKIRIPRGATKTWSNGPFCRYIAPSGALDGSNAPTLAPDHLRILIVWHALITFATEGGQRDPRPYQAAYDRAWAGDPSRGDGGILLWLKMHNPWQGQMAVHQTRSLTTHEVLAVENYSI